MKKLIENEIYKYESRLKECYDQDNRLAFYPVRRPMQCMVLKRFADTLRPGRIYKTSELDILISEYISFQSSETILQGLIEYNFFEEKVPNIAYQLREDYEAQYFSFLGLD